ncbi:MAG: hypothetical protein J2P34_04415 [Actinobacteria bacterium]|nr:hypothetical protein [Actinomycetota bacterium]
MAASVAAGPASNAAVPGILGFLVVAGMGIALFFLLRSMNKQLRKVTPPPPRTGRRGPAPAATDRAAHTARAGGGEPDQGGPGPG